MPLTNPFIFCIQLLSFAVSLLSPTGSTSASTSVLGEGMVPYPKLRHGNRLLAFDADSSRHDQQPGVPTRMSFPSLSNIQMWNEFALFVKIGVATISNSESIHLYLVLPVKCAKLFLDVAGVSGHGNVSATMSFTNPFVFCILFAPVEEITSTSLKCRVHGTCIACALGYALMLMLL